jgi:hypothetical protein
VSGGGVPCPAHVAPIDPISAEFSLAASLAFFSAAYALSSGVNSPGCFAVEIGVIYLALAASLAVGSVCYTNPFASFAPLAL